MFAFIARSRPIPARLPVDVLVAPLFAILLMAGLVWLGGTGLAHVLRHTEQIANYNMDAAIKISRIPSRVQAVDSLFYRIMARRAAGGDKGAVQADLDQLAGEIDAVVDDLAAYRDAFASPHQRQAVDQLRDELVKYKQALQWVGAMLEIDFPSAVSFIQPFNALFDRLNRLMAEMTADLQQDARQQAAAAAHEADTTGRWFLFISVSTATGAVLASWITGRHQLQMNINAHVLESEVAARTSELTQTASELRAAKEQAEKALVEVRVAQRQLIEAEKMAALGSLVAGIAHEVNTPVGSALTAVSVLDEKTKYFTKYFADNSIRRVDLAHYLENVGEATMLILSNIRRAAELIQSFKQVAVDQASAVRRHFIMRTCLDELLVSLRPRLRKTAIEVFVDCPPDLVLNSYPGALSQVVTNLVMNSLMHAYGEGTAGTIAMTVRHTIGDRVMFCYQDDGCGIPEAIQPKIFEPFFTTKRGAGGTGLGLHIAYNNVTQKLGGTITVDSVEGKGTFFILDFPREAPAETTNAPA